jgi:hypothetical protein
MDLAESIFIQKLFFNKERGAEVFKKNTPTPHPEVRALESYSATSYSCWPFDKKLPTDSSAHSSVGSLLFTTYSYWQRRYEQICNLFSKVQWTLATS